MAAAAADAGADPSSGGRRRYMKRREEEKADGDTPAAGGADDIRPGELNQAVQFRVSKCDLCWQELPPGYLPPAEEPWTHRHLQDSPCNPWLVHGTLHCCAICQEHRERKGRLDARSVAPATIVNPPPVQEMSMSEIGTRE